MMEFSRHSQARSPLSVKNSADRSKTRQIHRPLPVLLAVCGLALGCLPAVLQAQSVCLPAPRLLTTLPMGGQAGTEVEITITGDYLENAGEMVFSDPRITATAKPGAAGKPVPNQYVVSIAEDCPPGIYEARVMTRLGVSTSRIFSVGTLPEVVQKKPNTSLETAMELPVNSICNASMTTRAVDHYTFQARKGQRIVVDCATGGIDSRLDAVVIVADAEGRDLLVERRGGALDFTAPADGRYVIKVHELTFKGGPTYFYRLAVRELPSGAPIVRMPSTMPVNSFSWPPQGLAEHAATSEAEPNNEPAKAQKITLPCDIAGSFFPAADIDVFEFDAKKGEVWWVEVASERFGRPTDPSILVQQVTGTGDQEKRIDVAEFSDIPSPVKVSSNGYAYDGPPYNAGSSDILGKLVIKADGLHRLQISDLFGGTRNESRNIYRLVIRKATPDFAVVAWALHMQLRNGDRNALSKPISLRGGSTMALEVVALRRDGFNGDINLVMENLPEGVTAHGLKIPAGQSRGLMLITAKQEAPRAFNRATFYGSATIDGKVVKRPCSLASMAWPVTDAWQEIPSPRLLTDVPVSVSGFDLAPLTIAPEKAGVLEVTAGQKITIPLTLTRRSEFSGAKMELKAIGAGFERTPKIDLPLTGDKSQVVIDLATLKTPPGDYLLAFYGGAVAKYSHNPEAVTIAEQAHSQAEQEVKALAAEAKKVAAEAQAAPVEKKEAAQKAVTDVAARQKVAAAALTKAAAELKQATAAAKPKDIVDIVVSEPIAIRVQPAEKK